MLPKRFFRTLRRSIEYLGERDLTPAAALESTTLGPIADTMNTNLLRALRTIADALPPGSSVTLQGEWLRAQLEEAENRDTEDEPVSHRMSDLTVEQVAEELGRSGSTVRGWLAAAEFPNAFKLNRREWRIPISDVRAFLDRQRPQVTSQPEAPRVRRSAKRQDDLSSWRQHLEVRR